jgi:NADH-quinone oxidoreductase subunit E
MAPAPAPPPEHPAGHWSATVAARGGTPASAPAAFTVRTGTLLGGETALAAERGNWRYAAPAAASAPPAPEAASRPAGLAAAREGSADDLKDIKGVGPKLEILLHSLGVFHFDQIAAWTEAEIAWVDQNLEGFRGRVTRDAWVAQAKVLAAGRAKTGDVS